MPGAVVARPGSGTASQGDFKFSSMDPLKCGWRLSLRPSNVLPGLQARQQLPASSTGHLFPASERKEMVGGTSWRHCIPIAATTETNERMGLRLMLASF